MKIIKRNQLIILIIGLMLVTAGYLNFLGTNEELMQASTNTHNDETIGDATLVDSKAIVPNETSEDLVAESSIQNETKNEINDEIKTNTTETASSIKDEVTNTSEETVAKTENNTNSKTTENSEYFTSTKLQRDTMYSQMIESYQKLLDSSNITAEQKAIAQNEIKKINDTKNAIMISENLIKNKGIKDLVILVNDININVIVSGDKIEQETIAQIQNIISREMKARDRKYSYK